jgi:DNA-binding beta-propeller fold protein YncE
MFAIVLPVLLLADPRIESPVGTGEKGFAGDGGPATKALLNQPFDVAFDKSGNLYLSDSFNHRIRRVDTKSGIITTVAGNGKKGFGGDGGKATEAMLNEPYGIELDQDGNLFIVDRLNYCIRKVDAKTGTIATVAGTGGKSGYDGDGGLATKSLLVEPNGIALDGKGKLFIADVAGHRVRVVDLIAGTIATLAGNGKGVTVGDGGPVEQATFNGPRALAVHPDGSLLVVERNGNSVRRIDLKNGVVARFAGTGKKGYTGDGGKALDAAFDGPKEIDIDKDGNVYVVDTENEAIRRIDAKSGMITTVAGKGRTKTPGLGDGGPPTDATLGRPHGVAIGPDGAIYIGDTNSHRVRRVK